MYYETMLEKMARVQLKDYQGSPYQKLKSVGDEILATYYDNKEPAETAIVDFTVNGKKVK